MVVDQGFKTIGQCCTGGHFSALEHEKMLCKLILLPPLLAGVLYMFVYVLFFLFAVLLLMLLLIKILTIINRHLSTPMIMKFMLV